MEEYCCKILDKIPDIPLGIYECPVPSAVCHLNY